MESTTPQAETPVESADARPSKKTATPRAAKALPTDRIKFDAQVEALKAFAIESNNGQQAVTSGDIAPHIGVVETTAGLNNAFFMDAGLIVRESKGRYKPTKATIEYARAIGFDAQSAKAHLAEPLAKTWFYAAVKAMGTANQDRVIQVLANKAGAMVAHRSKLEALLEWLEYAGLIAISGGKVQMASSAPPASPEGEKEAPPEKTETPPAPEGKGATKGASPPAKGPAVLEFNFSCSLTAEDLGKLDAEQITALYSAVGGVMAAQATLSGKK